MAFEHILSEGKLNPENFFMVIQERAKLNKALNEALPDEREWLTTVMFQFTKSERGFLYYEKACSEFSKPYIDSLVKRNLVHLRPTKQLEDGVPVLMPETPCGLIAMRKILQLEQN